MPKLLSLLADHDPNAEVIGLDSVPAEDRPPVNIVHWSFQIMVGIGTGLALLGTVFFVTWLRRRRLPRSRWFYRAVMAAGPLSIVALIAGWITTEVGRQPWIVYETMRTDAGGHLGRRARGRLRRARRGLRQPRRRRRVAAAAAHAAAGGDGGRGLMLPELCVGLVILGVTAYAVLGSADFGAGFWDLTAGGAERGGAVRGMVQRSMSPVWEANHVWLIFVLVMRVDGVPGRVRLDLLDAVDPALPGRAGDHLPRRRVRAARAGGDDQRGARAGRAVRALARC